MKGFGCRSICIRKDTFRMSKHGINFCRTVALHMRRDQFFMVVAKKLLCIVSAIWQNRAKFNCVLEELTHVSVFRSMWVDRTGG